MNVRGALATFRGHRVPRLNIITHKNWWFALSGAFIVLSIVGLVVRGLNFSIDFKGGAQLTFANSTNAGQGAYQAVLNQYLPGQDAANSQVEFLNGGAQVTVRTASLTTIASGQQIRVGLAKVAGISPNQINEQDVGPTWGSTISTKALEGLIIFLILVTLYISVRFEWKMSIGALAALAHDLIITAGIYALVGRQVTPESVIAILTILGYSLYDDVVIFDKIKENADTPSIAARETYSSVANMSLNQTLMRSVNTSLVVLLPIGALLLFGGQTLKDFAFALFVGIASGTYSSIFVASPILTVLKEREPRYQRIRTTAVTRSRGALRSVPGGAAAAAVAVDGPEDDPSLEPAAARGPSQARPEARAAGGGQRPRPAGGGGAGARKKRKPQGKPKKRRR